MKKILLFTCVIPLLTTTGCLVSESGHSHHGHARYESRTEVIVPAPPVLVVRPPEIIVR